MGNDIKRIIGSNSHGNENEKRIVNALNNTIFSNLNNNLKEFVKYIARDNNIVLNHNTIINARIEKNNQLKQDIYLMVDSQEFSISLKIGSGNSVHQEKCEDFIKYIRNTLNASDIICNNFRFFLWADGTLDGTGSTEEDPDGNIISRFSSKEFREKYPNKYYKLQEFLNNNKQKLIERFLFVGRHNSKVDYVYHGNEINGFWVSSREIIELNLSYTKGKGLNIGKLSLQSWNISRKGNTEKKRGQLQVKYSQMKKDFFSIMKTNIENVSTFIGNKEEFDISSRFNKNKYSSLWNDLTKDLTDLDNIFMIKVSNRVLSNLSNKKVYPKADAYLVRSNFDINYLLGKQFSLDEKDLENREYSIIKNSGISVKVEGSSGYTIQKLTHDSFIKAFSDILDEPEYVFLALLLYSNEKEKFKNNEMIEMMVIDKDKVTNYYMNQLTDSLNLNNIKDLSAIRKWAQQELKECIKNNFSVYQSLFTGSDWFEEPYVAHYIYLNKTISPNELTDFCVTTGSGRSKGKYSIEIKPVN